MLFIISSTPWIRISCHQQPTSGLTRQGKLGILGGRRRVRGDPWGAQPHQHVISGHHPGDHHPSLQCFLLATWVLPSSCRQVKFGQLAAGELGKMPIQWVQHHFAKPGEPRFGSCPTCYTLADTYPLALVRAPSAPSGVPPETEWNSVRSMSHCRLTAVSGMAGPGPNGCKVSCSMYSREAADRFAYNDTCCCCGCSRYRRAIAPSTQAQRGHRQAFPVVSILLLLLLDQAVHSTICEG